MLNFKALKSATTPDTRARLFTFSGSGSNLTLLQVTIQRLGLRLHMCADTMTAVGVFIGDLVEVFKPPSEHQYDLH